MASPLDPSGCSKPKTKFSPYLPLRSGSSPGVSWPRPHRGSRRMFRFGDQNVKPFVTPSLASARASAPMTEPTARKSVALNDAAVEIAAGNPVGQRLEPSSACAQPAWTPWSASLHQLCGWSQSRGRPAAPLTSSCCTSSGATRSTRSATRFARGRSPRQKGRLDAGEDGVQGVTGWGERSRQRSAAASRLKPPLGFSRNVLLTDS